MRRGATASRMLNSAVGHTFFPSVFGFLSVFGLSLSTIAAADRAKPTAATQSPAATDSHEMTQEACDTGCTGALIRCIQYASVGRDRCDAKAEKAYEKCLNGIKKPESAVQSGALRCDSGLPSNLANDADE